MTGGLLNHFRPRRTIAHYPNMYIAELLYHLNRHTFADELLLHDCDVFGGYGSELRLELDLGSLQGFGAGMEGENKRFQIFTLLILSRKRSSSFNDNFNTFLVTDGIGDGVEQLIDAHIAHGCGATQRRDTSDSVTHHRILQRLEVRGDLSKFFDEIRTLLHQIMQTDVGSQGVWGSGWVVHGSIPEFECVWCITSGIE
ncbi:hypothetical protein BMS3Bbin04_00503 [bacterium BMS3Bbin04]|nr:hypothetical protein BMS3Bbin04_00503 [bacterium BMS3Bbin04]